MKAIETIYHGWRFRSRSEARWAVFFDTLGIAYRYELEGFDLEDVWYLPDFWLPELNCWVEIKAEKPTEEELEKCRRLTKHTGKMCLLIAGDVWFRNYTVQMIMVRSADEELCERSFGSFAICRTCPGLWVIDRDGARQSLRCTPSCPADIHPREDDPRLMEAYKVAREARFEHGEHGRREQGSEYLAPFLNQDIPLLPAYIKRRMQGDQLHVWCEHCLRWHEHRPDEQYQVLRASCNPYIRFYRIYYAGHLTPDIERMHGRIPEDIVPLTEQQLACWVALHQAPRIFRKLGRHLHLQQLLTLLELNGRTEHIQGTSSFDRPLYLGWMLLHTPQVHWLKRTPWRFRLQEEYLQQAQQQKLPTIRFPENLDHVPYWLQAQTQASEDKLFDWVAYTSYVQWAEGKRYIKLSKDHWDEAMQELGYVALWQKVPNQEEQRYYEGIRLK